VSARTSIEGQGAIELGYGRGPDAWLGYLSALFEDVQKVRRASENRAFAALESDMGPVGELALAISVRMLEEEERIGRRLRKVLRSHPVGPWLADKKGLRGPLVARLVSIIGDPRRFPGQPCSGGHVLVPGYDEGDRCPVTNYEGERCPATMREPRSGKGIRPLWAYLGLHVVDGRSPRRQKGRQITWHPLGRRLVLGPDGVADQIVRFSTPGYRELYDRTKARLGVERRDAAGHVDGPRPIVLHNIARKVAAKAFVGDLLTEWKRSLQ